jgi:hypothetical protein
MVRADPIRAAAKPPLDRAGSPPLVDNRSDAVDDPASRSV